MAQILFYAMAVAGALVRNINYGILNIFMKACYVPYVFWLSNFSALTGFIRYSGAKQSITWEKAREGIA